jgi:hypothetical protein
MPLINPQVLLTGGQAVREVTGLQRKSKLRPDLQIVDPGRHALTDVAVVHSLGVYGCQRPEDSTATAKKMAVTKRGSTPPSPAATTRSSFPL